MMIFREFEPENHGDGLGIGRIGKLPDDIKSRFD